MVTIVEAIRLYMPGDHSSNKLLNFLQGWILDYLQRSTI